MEHISKRPQLPALSYPQGKKVKRETDVPLTHNVDQLAALNNTAASSPAAHCPPGPPPPYTPSHVTIAPLQHANNRSDQPPSSHTPGSHWLGDGEDEAAKQPVKQSLPSIMEALGPDSQSVLAQPQSALPSARLPPPSSGSPASPTPSRRSFPVDSPQGPPTSFPPATTYPHYPQYRPDAQPPLAQHSTYLSSDTLRPPIAYPPIQEPKPLSQLHSSTPHTAGSMGPPGNFPYGYAPYPPKFANSTPPSSVSSGPISQPPVGYAASQQTSQAYQSENAAGFDHRAPTPASYGDSVKRHLDMYDLESALNQVASTSGILVDFSRRYGDRMHHTQRSEPSLSTLPGLVEVDDMISKSRVQLDSLVKIREVIVVQQAAYEQQAADQRARHKAFGETVQHPPEQQQQQSDADESKTSGSSGADSKTRRGRAAPPGRCHSCNRAETPEWRRGPDGARTLCNACGLHYAKLTRKSNGANKTANAGSSNLRPKENVAL